MAKKLKVTLVKSLALELAPSGIRVLALAPVATDTPMLPTFMGKSAVDDEGRARYVATLDRSFEVYAGWIEPAIEYFTQLLPRGEGTSPGASKATVRAQAPDPLRGLPP